MQTPLTRHHLAAAAISLLTIIASTLLHTDENASNPLAAVNNTDLRWQFTGDSDSDKHDIFVDDSYMLFPTLKLKYGLHHNVVDIDGQMADDVEKVSFKAIWFPHETKLNDTWVLRGGWR